MLDPEVWSAVPFHFWSVVAFVMGSMIGSFLNVCIYRMPLGMSIVHPRSHCPHCKHAIPALLNIPLVTWLYLGGKCANCKAPISSRYFFVELLTGLVFLFTWLRFGPASAGVAIAYCLLLAGFIVATFIDFEHFIIPDEITFGGMGAGLVASILVPEMHQAASRPESLFRSMLGLGVGAGVVFAILKFGKLLFGREKLAFPESSKLIFTETHLHLPDEERPFEDIFYSESDTIVLEAKHVELIDRCYSNVTLRLSPKLLIIGKEEFDPSQVKHMEVIADKAVLPREAMGFGDVKFMAAIGAFLGWQATIFSLMVSAVIGSFVGVSLILSGRKDWSSRLPYGPYIALAAIIWMVGGKDWFDSLFAVPGPEGMELLLPPAPPQ
ncbi:MAG TPA: prepilin peptidase [Verrucomicrobiae bacterium]